MKTLKYNSFYKRLFAFVLSVALIIPLLSESHTATYSDSGIFNCPKLTKTEIEQMLADNPIDMPESADQIFDATPSTRAPYSAGKVNVGLLQRALGRLNVMRAIGGVPAASLNAEMCDVAQYGAVLAAASEFSHYPPRPSDMREAFYLRGYQGTSSSNLSGGRTLLEAVDMFMCDYGLSNLQMLGHRRWQLNPDLGKVGFGYVTTTTGYKKYVAENVLDRSGVGGDYQFIAWPASGNFPSTLFNSDVAWSIVVNPNRYAVPVKADLTVTIKRESDGRTWTFSGRKSYTATESGEYFNVDTSSRGVANCIIFRPASPGRYEGLYTVTVSGLKTVSGEKTSLAYQVEFFEPGPGNSSGGSSGGTSAGGSGNTTPSTVAGFSDVPSTAYYADAVVWAVSNGVTNGTGANTFSPDMTCTRGQVVTFLWRACGCPEPQSTANPFSDVKTSDFFYKPVLWAVEQGITNGTGANMFSPEWTCSYSQILTFIWRANGSPNKTGGGAWYDDSVRWARSIAMLRSEDGAFDPDASCPRRDVVLYLWRNATR